MTWLSTPMLEYWTLLAAALLGALLGAFAVRRWDRGVHERLHQALVRERDRYLLGLRSSRVSVFEFDMP
ncbi:MAG TPA: hypothetical protein VFX59_27255, partial [Polyangiales bacterium]|nr:hypothetical protein [Polyangiales bacterium]